ncbi:uncharacterized protein LOC143039689 [Oratosquilla oratoria]|uniref:uncharacterized protein LOC143039689 n=1 Tax=Oratosquilla oratoria TaxID=337810 RepID=UPI003F766BDA
MQDLKPSSHSGQKMLDMILWLLLSPIPAARTNLNLIVKGRMILWTQVVGLWGPTLGPLAAMQDLKPSSHSGQKMLDMILWLLLSPIPAARTNLNLIVKGRMILW